MKKKLAPIFLIPIFAYTLYFVVFSGHIAPRHPFEKSVLLDEQGNQIAVKDFKGKVVIVTYFQSWCRDCRLELPQLEELQQHFGDKLTVMVITDESFEISNRVKTYLNVDLQFYQSEKKLKEIGIHRFPTTYLLDKKGEKVTSRVEGINWDNEETIKEIEALMK